MRPNSCMYVYVYTRTYVRACDAVSMDVDLHEWWYLYTNMWMLHVWCIQCKVTSALRYMHEKRIVHCIYTHTQRKLVRADIQDITTHTHIQTHINSHIHTHTHTHSFFQSCKVIANASGHSTKSPEYWRVKLCATVLTTMFPRPHPSRTRCLYSVCVVLVYMYANVL